MEIDVGLTNGELYKGCAIETVNGRLNLVTPIIEATALVGANIERMMSSIPSDQKGTVTLTGPMAVWAYLVVFHAVVHRFREVYYDDGRSGAILIAKHG